MVRCVFGNPFQPVEFAPSWRTPLTLSLARAAYEERLMPSAELDPVRLLVLADALEEVGSSPAVLEHLRGPGPHVRGCHVLDLALGLK